MWRILILLLWSVVAHSAPSQKTKPPTNKIDDVWFVVIGVRTQTGVEMRWLKKPYRDFHECERFSFQLFDILRNQGFKNVVTTACWSAEEWINNYTQNY